MAEKKSKVTLTGLGLKKLNVDTIEVDFNGAPIEVITYIPTTLKFAIINDTVGLSMVGGIFNPIAIEAVFHALLVQHVTNINYSKGQNEHLIETYDLINESGLVKVVCDALGDAYDEIVEDLMLVLDKIENKQKTFAEQLVDLVNSFSGVINDLNDLDEDNVKLIQDVVSKLEVVKKQ